MQNGLVIEYVQALGKSRPAQQIDGIIGAVALVDLEADDLAAEQVQDQIQIEPRPINSADSSWNQ